MSTSSAGGSLVEQSADLQQGLDIRPDRLGQGRKIDPVKGAISNPMQMTKQASGFLSSSLPITRDSPPRSTRA